MRTSTDGAARLEGLLPLLAPVMVIAGLAAMEGWMKELGLALTIGELGATEEMLEGIADATIHLDGGYKILSREDILQVLRESL